MQLIETKVISAWKEGKTIKSKPTRAALCFDPPIEVSEHPTEKDLTLLTTQYGTKRIPYDFDTVLMNLRAM